MEPWLTLLEYSFVIPHDVKTLIEFMGGEKTFESRLDLMVSRTSDAVEYLLTSSSSNQTCPFKIWARTVRASPR
jgi:putative alpha-1,2-mannosidase